MSDTFSDLGWLPRAPADFSAQIRDLTRRVETALAPGEECLRLSRFALDEAQLFKLSKLIGVFRAAGADLAPLAPLKLAVVSNATYSFIAPALAGTAARFGIDLEWAEIPYGQVMQEVLSPASGLYAAKPDVILLALDYHGLPIELRLGQQAEAEAVVTRTLDYIDGLREAIHANCRALVICQTIARPPETLFGSLDFALPGTLRTLVEAINRRLADSLVGSKDLLLDVAGVAETVGLANWHDPALWNLAKLPFNGQYTPLYADCLCRLIAAMQGKSRRALVLDLDNTVWGGVIGDDGLEGIKIAQGDATGEAHLEVQKTALDLRTRGVVLAVSSKNTDEIARKPFQDHPEMLLREEHLAVFQANWNDKASNIKAIADQLSLGVASLAFLDDNPMERDLVRTMLPTVAVPELPEDPALYARTLLASGYFEAAFVSDEDFQRAAFFQDNARRVELQGKAGSLDDYLKSLKMEIFFRPFDATGRARIAQLISKSNQFNLTTKRYTEADVAALEADPEVLDLQIRLTDAFGDNGMICVVVCRPAGSDWEIDTWLMSCRVLGRKVEEAVLAEIGRAAKAAGAKRLIGVYKPTSRNGIVVDHYKNLGFELQSQDASGQTTWAYSLADLGEPDLPMAVHRLERDAAVGTGAKA